LVVNGFNSALPTDHIRIITEVDEIMKRTIVAARKRP
jgi:hypothetical protein